MVSSLRPETTSSAISEDDEDEDNDETNPQQDEQELYKELEKKHLWVNIMKGTVYLLTRYLIIAKIGIYSN
jgi:hypothetical protein